MSAATMATAAGAAALLFYTFNRRLQSCTTKEEQCCTIKEDNAVKMPLGIDRVSHRLIRAPATWLETISTLSEILRFTYSETLGKWPIVDLAFGISFLLKRQGNFLVDSVFGGRDSARLKGSKITAELKYLSNLLTLCWHFSKKPLPLFLKETCYTEENVLLHEPKAGILKPAFTVIADQKTRCFLLLIRGTHSIKDTLTAATGALVPFHHTVVHEGGVRDLVLGYAHCGMVAAARWIAKLATPCLIEALGENPDYKVKIVGHSLGGGTAALLTYILREQKELSETSCVAFAPGACMTWELAESGNDFITSVINGADLVPTFSAASVDDLRAEVTASAWINDLRNKIGQTRILKTVYSSASALGSRLPSIATARAKLAGARAILRPVSSGTQVVMRRAHSMAQAAWRRPALGLSSLSCMGPRCGVVVEAHSNCTEEVNSSKCSAFTIDQSAEPLLSSRKILHGAAVQNLNLPVSSPVSKINPDSEDNSDNDSDEDHHRPGNSMNEAELWQQLKHELCDRTEEDKIREEEEEVATMEEGTNNQSLKLAPKVKEVHRFFPPGRIMHIVMLNSYSPAKCEENEANSPNSSSSSDYETKIGIFLTSRSLYSKMRLSQTMINDHFMPVYIRQMERLIKELEVEEDDHSTSEVVLL